MWRCGRGLAWSWLLLWVWPEFVSWKASSRAFSLMLPRLNMAQRGAHVCVMPFCFVEAQKARAKSASVGVVDVVEGPKSP
ncbi:hypothetical protein ONZ43_g4214 [Nemania bipapillata]|uniref:Uncharacterized protein n=1 Tax=Nemania bipapillata TaxID=110536 RepID=A0ACC2IQH8_9PEZI|nr:hypothetical protein ONZ43_g4214 [Nemania bipapillata]